MLNDCFLAMKHKVLHIPEGGDFNHKTKQKQWQQ